MAITTDYTLYFGIKAACPLSGPGQLKAFEEFKKDFNSAMRKRANCDAGINIISLFGVATTATTAALQAILGDINNSIKMTLNIATALTPICTTFIAGILKLYKDVLDSSGMKQLQALAVTGMERGYFDDNIRVQAIIDGLSGNFSPLQSRTFAFRRSHTNKERHSSAALIGSSRYADFVATSAEEGMVRQPLLSQ